MQKHTMQISATSKETNCTYTGIHTHPNPASESPTVNIQIIRMHTNLPCSKGTGMILLLYGNVYTIYMAMNCYIFANTLHKLRSSW